MQQQTVPPQELWPAFGSAPVKVWTPRAIGGISFLLGFPGGLLLVSINRWRMGLRRGAQNLMIAGSAGFLLYVVVVILTPSDAMQCVTPLMNIAVAYYLYRRAAADMHTFETANGQVTVAHWLIGALLGLVGTLVFLVMSIGMAAMVLNLATLAGVAIPD